MERRSAGGPDTENLTEIRLALDEDALATRARSPGQDSEGSPDT